MDPIKNGVGTVISGGGKVVTGSFTANSQSSDSIRTAFPGPVAIRLSAGTVAFVGTVDFSKSYDKGTTWIVVKQYTATADEIYEEIEQGVYFKLGTSAYTSGNIVYRLVAK